ncbi:MAG: hypothetical protein M0Q53_01965 [Prolixibacteraceae bacterium]|jgi:hypothetical protein|nr:hypothetical protein [Prolixibacteraceae bacterium]
MKKIVLAVAFAFVVFSPLQSLAAGKENRTKEATLNGLHIVLDANTGTILKMSYAGTGTILDSKSELAGMIDLAYPVTKFEVLRLASRFSQGADVSVYPDSVVIFWDRLGLSRTNFNIEGKVSATVKLVASPDGKSVFMSAKIINLSGTNVRQVIFPDFSGLLPVAGAQNTYFRTGNFANLPFVDLAKDDTKESTPYMIDAANYSVQYVGSGMMRNKDMIVRWMDLGGLNGGISLFPKRWGWDPQVPIRLRLSELEPKLRMMCLNDTTIKKGETWQSGEWVLTPHQNGWAAGIAPYKAWVKQNYKRYYPLPKHVREGIGFRTVFMSQYQPTDPKDAIFTFKDLPKLAAECKENGLDEMVIWAWCEAFTLPLPKPFAHLGTEEDMVTAVKECKKLGVNLVPFITVLQANQKTAPRYNMKVLDNKGWTYHTELIPTRNPNYATYMASVQAGPTNKLWQKDVLEGLKHLVEIGIPSFCWDQFYTTPDPEPNMISLAKQILDVAKKREPDCTFSGEELLNFELDAGLLDYTWNWDGYMDRKVITSAFPSPRINSCISSSPQAVKKAFADNLYMNLFPRKAESINGSDYIANYPELSKALKQCAKLKKQFLPYFTEGDLVGDCLLSKPLPGVHTCAYALPDRAVMIIINTSLPKQTVEFDVKLASWIKSASGKYEMRQYNENGELVASTSVKGACHMKSKSLEINEMALFEMIGK